VAIVLMGLALKVQTHRLDAVRAEYGAFVADVKAKGEAQEQKARETIERQQRESHEAEKRSQRALSDIRSKYDRLRGAVALPTELQGRCSFLPRHGILRMPRQRGVRQNLEHVADVLPLFPRLGGRVP
jgi:hypothetical protein